MDVNEHGGGFLPDASYPNWCTFYHEGSSIIFEVPQVEGHILKTMICIVFSSSPDAIASDDLKNVLVKNYTKATIHLYKKEALISFEDEEGQRVVSSMEPGNKVEVVVVFENHITVENIRVYLVYDEPIEMEQCQASEENYDASEPASEPDLRSNSDSNLVVSGPNSNPVSNPALDSVVSDSKPNTEPAPNPESELKSEPVRIHDVFLSFRGEDTRSSFTSHLYAALQNSGIKVFRDDDSLQRGDHISTSLSHAIELSRISIIVFSKNYADSRWCLNELEKIIKCRRTIGQKVVPVFYDVDPTDVRKQEGEFGRAFQSLLNRSSNEVELVQSWKEALRAAASLAGCVVLNFR